MAGRRLAVVEEVLPALMRECESGGEGRTNLSRGVKIVKCGSITEGADAGPYSKTIMYCIHLELGHVLVLFDLIFLHSD